MNALFLHQLLSLLSCRSAKQTDQVRELRAIIFHSSSLIRRHCHRQLRSNPLPSLLFLSALHLLPSSSSTAMSKRKGLSMDEKKVKMLDWMQSHKECYTMKELESTASKATGVSQYAHDIATGGRASERNGAHAALLMFIRSILSAAVAC